MTALAIEQLTGQALIRNCSTAVAMLTLLYKLCFSKAPRLVFAKKFQFFETPLFKLVALVCRAFIKRAHTAGQYIMFTNVVTPTTENINTHLVLVSNEAVLTINKGELG